MIIYWLFFSLPILLSINNIRFYNQKRFNFLLLYSFFCILFIGFRYEVGGDWGNYIALAEQQLIGLDPRLITSPPVNTHSIAYNFLSRVSVNSGLDVLGVNLICALIFIFTGEGQLNIFSDPTMQFIFRDWFTNGYYVWKFILIMGIAASISFVCVFSAYSVASPSAVSLFEYSLIIWAIIIGYFLFDEIPNLRIFIGITLIIGAGIYIFMREKVRDQSITVEAPKRR